MRKILVLLAILSLALTGSLMQKYNQKIYENGDSLVSDELDMTLISQMLPHGSLEAMAAACMFDEDLGCSVDVERGTLYVVRSMRSGGHYTFSAERGLLETTYTVRIGKLPNDMFTDAVDEILVNAGVKEVSGGSAGPTDLGDRESAAAMAATMGLLGMEMLYEVEMPGEVISARSGETAAAVDGSTATFPMHTVLSDSAPLEISSRQVNWQLIILGVGLVAVVLLAVSFSRTRRIAAEERAARKGEKGKRRR